MWFFPNTKRLPIEKWKKKNAVHHEICCRIIFWVLRINKKFFSYLKHCTGLLPQITAETKVNRIKNNISLISQIEENIQPCAAPMYETSFETNQFKRMSAVKRFMVYFLSFFSVFITTEKKHQILASLLLTNILRSFLLKYPNEKPQFQYLKVGRTCLSRILGFSDIISISFKRFSWQFFKSERIFKICALVSAIFTKM